MTLLFHGNLGSSPQPHLPSQVKAAVRLARQRRPDLALEGPIQYDAAVDPAVAAVKVKGESQVAGQATVCIFPDLNSGNNTYKVRAAALPTTISGQRLALETCRRHGCREGQECAGFRSVWCVYLN